MVTPSVMAVTVGEATRTDCTEQFPNDSIVVTVNRSHLRHDLQFRHEASRPATYVRQFTTPSSTGHILLFTCSSEGVGDDEKPNLGHAVCLDCVHVCDGTRKAAAK